MSEFELVVYKRNRRLRQYRGRRLSNNVVRVGVDSVLSLGYIEKKISEARYCIRTSSWYSTLLKFLNSCLLELGTSSVQGIICYGLGNFSDYATSRLQLALLLELKEHFLSEVLIYDPLFTPKEKELLAANECVLIKRNEEGKHKVSKISIVYLPHCPKQLINNFLWSNWGLTLSNCIILGNSLFSIKYSNPDKLIKSTLKYIYDIYSFVKEIELENSFICKDVFNDISIHIFPLSKLLKFDSEFWESPEVPVYSEDLEFVKSIPELEEDN